MIGCLFSSVFAVSSLLIPSYEIVGLGTNSVRREVKRITVAPRSIQAIEGRVKYSGKGGTAQIGTEASVFSSGVKDGSRDFCYLSRGGNDGVFKLALGHWRAEGIVRFEDVRIRELRPKYAKFGEIKLGYGERIDGNRYGFGFTVFGKSSNDARPLVEHHKTLSQNGIITLFKNGYLIFQHQLKGRRFEKGCISINTAYMQKTSRAKIEVSLDRVTWRELGSAISNGTFKVDIPNNMMPCATIYSRVSAIGNSCSFASIAFDAEIDGASAFAFGSTRYCDVETDEVVISAEPWKYLSEVTGELLPGDSTLSVWRELPERKVFKGRPLPSRKELSLEFSLAGNESEARQLVIRPNCDIEDLQVTASIEGLGVSVKRVGYVFIDALSDSMGTRGYWPDPLFPQKTTGCSVKKGENQPFWVKVRAPRNTKRGERRGFAKVSYRCKGSSERRSLKIPVAVQVFGFSLPTVPACESAFGLDWHTVFKYHRITDNADKMAVAKYYHELFGEHRISPYNVLPLGVSYGGGEQWYNRGDPDNVRVDFNWDSKDLEMARLFDVYGFSTFKTWVRGLGGGDNTGSKKRSIAGYRHGNKTYERLVKSYAKQLQDHYEEKGWLDKAYVYMYDEPLESHFPYVMESARILREGAPKLRRMVTAAPHEKLLGGPNLWCPITQDYNPYAEAWRKAREAGDRFWWYITFSSREPLVNEHIEHSGIDSRLWLWQTWGEKFSGILMWETASWRGNPYDTPSYRNANGIVRSSSEGLYIYPPVECFGPQGKVFAPPVDSIRFDLLREGLEDYDYFALLKKKKPTSSLLKVPEDVYRSLRDYSTDSIHVHRHRNAIAAEIEGCSFAGDKADF